MKFYYCVAALLLLVIVLEGFGGEFRNPGALDVVKWICAGLMAACLLWAGRRNHE